MNENNMPNANPIPAEQVIERPDLRPPPTAAPWYRRPTAFYYLIGLGIAVWIAVRCFPTTSSTQPPTTADPPTQGIPGTNPDVFDPKTEAIFAESARKAKIAAAKVAQRRTADLGDEVLSAVSEGQFEASECERELALMLDDDSGRRIAAKPELVRAFRAVCELERPQAAEFDKFLLDSSSAFLEAATSDFHTTQPDLVS